VARTLYLVRSHAARDYICGACDRPIARGSEYFRHEPHPFARTFRGERRTHWCHDCITNTPSFRDQVGRIWIRPSTLVRSVAEARGVQLELFRAHAVGIGRVLAERLAESPGLIHELTPELFQDFICDRLYAMGFEPKQVGSVFTKDGGIDVVFWPRMQGAFPFLAAAQLKHHRDPKRKEGSPTVRDFAGAIAGHPFNAALLVTNTTFSPDAEWFAKERAKIIRLRDFGDIRRWLQNDFSSPAEWREIPSSIEICPGVTVKIRS